MQPQARSRIVLVFTLVAITLALWVSSCKKDEPAVTGGGGGGGGTTSVRGIVTRADTTGNPPIDGASVRIGTAAPVITSATGEFTIPVEAGTNVTLTITKTGFSFNEVVVNVASGATRNITVGLLKEGASSTFSSTTAGTISDGSYKLSVPANFVNATGNVTVSVTGLDPTTSEIRALPGGLEAIDAQGNPRYLQPVSFAEYVARDANGNVLQVNQTSGSGANIELPIPESLRGQPGYRNGDPIECYLYDAATGKWKTPVPGLVGPSSVDGQPAIKATIFHLSWYGGAPALTARACIRGYVRNANGTPAAGVDVEAFAGGNTVTNSQGFYQVDAAPNSSVRVVGTAVLGTTVRSGEVLVFTGGTQDSCRLAPDITLGAPQQGSFEATAILYKIDGGTQFFDIASASLDLVAPGGTRTPWSTALVRVGIGAQMTTLPSVGNGEYSLTSPTIMLAAGQTYSITIDFDQNGTIDANGQIRMVGATAITSPAPGATVGRTFTAMWTDSGTVVPGYSANYWVTITGDSASRFFFTRNLTKVIGDGTIDTSIYGFPQPNDPLPAGEYNMSLWSLNGPAGFLTIGTPQPNINGQNVRGFFYAYSIGSPVSFTCTGLGATAARIVSGRQRTPAALKQMYDQLPASVRKRIAIKL
jgi:hypothetical protein